MNIDRYCEKLKTFMSFGRELVALSTCKRRKVGTIVFPVDCTAVYAIGYNGPPRSINNDSCTGVEGDCGCTHAEANALVKLRSDRKPSILFTTTAPCKHCAGLILNTDGIIGVLYDEVYRSSAGVDLLVASGLIRVYRVDEITTAALLIWHGYL